MPLPGAISADVLFALICMQKTYFVSACGPSIALLEGEAARNRLVKVSRQKRSSVGYVKQNPRKKFIRHRKGTRLA
jgi:hypothetical protein